MSARRVFVAYFGGEDDILEATAAARAAGFRVHDVYTPYAVHGMDEAMGVKPSRLTWACFGFGLLGLASALLLQEWTQAVDWPLNVGGKPANSLPAFIPVAFELTVLFAALGTVASLLLRTRLFPRTAPRVLLPRVTDDRFALALSASGDGFDEARARALCLENGALETAVLEVSR